MAIRYLQPQYAVAINRANPFGRKLLYGIAGGISPSASVTGDLVSLVGPITTKDGLVNFPNDIDGSRVIFNQFPEFNSSGFTVIAKLRKQNTSKNDSLFDTKRTNYWDQPVGFTFALRTDGGLIAQQGSATTYTTTNYTNDGQFHDVAFVNTPNKPQIIYVDGNEVSYALQSGATAYVVSPYPLTFGSYYDYSSNRTSNCLVEYAYILDGSLSIDEINQLRKNPWQVFKNVANPAFIPKGFGPVNHITEGSPEGPGADTTGSASHRPTSVVHQTGGSAKGFQASVTGVAERDRFHVTGGSVEGFTSTVVGTSTRYRMHPVTGTVVADYATVTGDAASSSPAGVHECEGIVVASEAIVVGTALNFSKLTSSGAVKGYQSTVVGTAKNVKKHSTNGAPIGKSSQVIGTAARLDPLVDHGTFGEVDGYQSSVTGSAVNQGAMTLTPADIAAIVAALQAAILPVNIVKVNDVDVIGSGQSGDTWGPA